MGPSTAALLHLTGRRHRERNRGEAGCFGRRLFSRAITGMPSTDNPESTYR
jgi:hypothetical protein